MQSLCKLPTTKCAFGAEEIPSGWHVGFGAQGTHLTAAVSLYPLHGIFSRSNSLLSKRTWMARAVPGRPTWLRSRPMRLVTALSRTAIRDH